MLYKMYVNSKNNTKKKKRNYCNYNIMYYYINVNIYEYIVLFIQLIYYNKVLSTVRLTDLFIQQKKIKKIKTLKVLQWNLIEYDIMRPVNSTYQVSQIFRYE